MHGLPRSNDDKRRAVSRLLDDPEWSKWSDREIARRCYVNHHLVSRLRSVTGSVPSERTYVTKHGTVATMNTTAIGGKFEAIDMPAAPAVQLEGGGTETEQAGATDLTDFREAPHRDGDHARPAAKNDSGMQGSLKYYLQKDDLGSVVRHPARQVAAAARTFKPKTLEKVRRRMERHRQWLSDFLAAALDDDSTEH